MASTFNQWAEFLNPDILRRRILSAALFMVGYEMLISSVVGRLRDFFLNGFDEHGPTIDESKYTETVLSLDPKNKKDPLRSSIVWLRQIEVIEECDVEMLRELADARNIFAHELGKIISGRSRPDFENLFPKMIDLVVKIDTFWIITDLETDPEVSADRANTDGIVPGSKLILDIIHSAALGDYDAAKSFYHEFIELA